MIFSSPVSCPSRQQKPLVVLILVPPLDSGWFPPTRAHDRLFLTCSSVRATRNTTSGDRVASWPVRSSVILRLKQPCFVEDSVPAEAEGGFLRRGSEL